MKSQKSEREAAEALKNRTKETLLIQYDHLKRYATSLDFDAAPVKIRLENARRAAEAIEKLRFVQLACSISETLEERFDSIAAARNNVPRFARPSHTAAPTVDESSQECNNSSNTPSSSQVSTC